MRLPHYPFEKAWCALYEPGEEFKLVEKALVEAVTRLQSLVSNQDAAGFARLMRRGQAYLQDRAAARQT